jgi:enoyl-[acyl-carrier protein] reductase II
MKTRITDLLGVKHPIILAGMSFISTPNLVAAVSNAGGFGIMAAGEYGPEDLRQAIRKTRSLTNKPFGVNVSLILPGAMERATILVEEKVPVVNYALGRVPDLIKAVHSYGGKVIASVALEKHALRAEKDGSDAVCVTGNEAAAHGGNVTSLVLIPRISDVVKVPVIAVGGFSDGKGLAAALVLGAEAISMGTRFAVTKESPVHDFYKQAIIQATIEDTLFSDRFDGMPGRVLKTPAAEKWMKRSYPIFQGVNDGLLFKRELKLSNWEFLKGVLKIKKGEGTSFGNLTRLPVGMSALKRAIEQGDKDGIMMAGQVSGRIDDIPTCAEFIERVVAQAEKILARTQSAL